MSNKVHLISNNIINFCLNNNVVCTAPKAIQKFFISLSPAFSRTICISDPVVKSDKINSIINTLIKYNKLPDFLVKSNIRCVNGELVLMDLITTQSEVTNGSSNPLYNDLSSSLISKLSKKFPILAEFVFISNDSTSTAKANSIIETLKLDKEFPSDIEFFNGKLQKKSSDSATVRNNSYNNNADDIMFDLGEIDLCHLFKTDPDFSSISLLGDKNEKLLNLIFHLNYLKVKNQLKSNKNLTNNQYSLNYLKNCAIIYSTNTKLM